MEQFLKRLNDKRGRPEYLELLRKCEAPRGNFNECSAISNLLTPLTINRFAPAELAERSIHDVTYGQPNYYDEVRHAIRGADNWFARAVEHAHGAGFLEFLRRKVHI